MKREQWSSNVGFLLAAAGSAIGLGNLWKFPYIAGSNGGAVFLILYLILLILLVQLFQTVGTRLAVKCDKRLKK